MKRTWQTAALSRSASPVAVPSGCERLHTGLRGPTRYHSRASAGPMLQHDVGASWRLLGSGAVFEGCFGSCAPTGAPPPAYAHHEPAETGDWHRGWQRPAARVPNTSYLASASSLASAPMPACCCAHSQVPTLAHGPVHARAGSTLALPKCVSLFAGSCASL